jgi:predicted ATP-grasp superfamily ATP-dependent carboligase
LAGDAPLAVNGTNGGSVYLLLGVEPSRNWQTFATEVIDAALAADVDAMVFLGAQLADVPHTRPTTIHVSSENPAVRGELDVERSQYEGPVGIISVLSQAAESAEIPTVNLWASVPHYVQHSPSPKATLALIDRLEEIIDVTIPRGTLVSDATAWEESINQLAADDDDMAAYIGSLEQARDAVDSPRASGEAIAQEFERFLRKKDGDGGSPGSNASPSSGE